MTAVPPVVRAKSLAMATDSAENTDAVFTSDEFDRTFHEEGGDSHPPPGRDFVLALGAAFVNAGWDVSQMDEACVDPKDQWWEHSYWYLFLEYEGQSFLVQLEPIPETDLWRVAFSLRRGCLLSLFGDHRKSLVMPRPLQTQVASIIERVANTTDLQWMSEDEALAIWYTVLRSTSDSLACAPGPIEHAFGVVQAVVGCRNSRQPPVDAN